MNASSKSRRFAFVAARIVVVVLLVASFVSCRSTNSRNRVEEKQFPKVILWAWERAEDLRFLDSDRFAVAFLAQTLSLKDDDVIITPRRQPLQVSPATKLIAVTRIESRKSTGARVALSETQRYRLAMLVTKTLDLPNVSAVQIDFDVVTSEREFYRELLWDVRRRLPSDTPLSMTALASFCVGDRWLEDLPVDEAVPMAFRMGADTPYIKSYLAGGNDFRGTLCQRSYGVSLDEPVHAKFGSRRVYVFNDHSWTPDDVVKLKDMHRQ